MFTMHRFTFAGEIVSKILPENRERTILLKIADIKV
jgi:hypothetical protein